MCVCVCVCVCVCARLPASAALACSVLNLAWHQVRTPAAEMQLPAALQSAGFGAAAALTPCSVVVYCSAPSQLHLPATDFCSAHWPWLHTLSEPDT